MFVVRRQRNQLAQHYLRQWFYFDTNYEYLTELERLNMKILYQALKQMREEERKFLADKYRVEKDERTGRHSKKDAVVACEYGMSFDEYRNKRIRIEDKFNRFIRKYIEQHQEEKSKLVGFFHGR